MGRKLPRVEKRKVEKETRGRRPKTKSSSRGSSLTVASGRRYLVGTSPGATSLGLQWGWGSGGYAQSRVRKCGNPLGFSCWVGTLLGGCRQRFQR